MNGLIWNRIDAKTQSPTANVTFVIEVLEAIKVPITSTKQASIIMKGREPDCKKAHYSLH